MILDFGSFIINESSLKKLKKDVHGVLNMSARKRMRKELRDNIITFKFRKRNGEVRTAHGTLHPDYLPKLKGGAPRPERQMVYYDLDKEGWRSFRSYSFIKILNIKPVDSSTPKPSPKPSSKPVTSDDEEEEIKKTKSIEKEEEEKEVKKPVSKKEESEDEEEHEYKSPIYDETEDEKKEREEDDEKIEKIKHKDKEEPEEEKEEKEDKDKEEKSEDE